ncbi:MAG: hypothetical protein LBC44_03055 [Mycoplasmataceae bacterium]|nr:hypothetical protein [Mycoplasmataceae bacterium]
MFTKDNISVFGGLLVVVFDLLLACIIKFAIFLRNQNRINYRITYVKSKVPSFKFWCLLAGAIICAFHVTKVIWISLHYSEYSFNTLSEDAGIGYKFRYLWIPVSIQAYFAFCFIAYGLSKKDSNLERVAMTAAQVSTIFLALLAIFSHYNGIAFFWKDIFYPDAEQLERSWYDYYSLVLWIFTIFFGVLTLILNPIKHSYKIKNFLWYLVGFGVLNTVTFIVALTLKTEFMNIYGTPKAIPGFTDVIYDKLCFGSIEFYDFLIYLMMNVAGIIFYYFIVSYHVLFYKMKKNKNPNLQFN